MRIKIWAIAIAVVFMLIVGGMTPRKFSDYRVSVVGPIPKGSKGAGGYVGAVTYKDGQGDITVFVVVKGGLSNDPEKVRSDLRRLVSELGLPLPSSIEICGLPSLEPSLNGIYGAIENGRIDQEH